MRDLVERARPPRRRGPRARRHGGPGVGPPARSSRGPTRPGMAPMRLQRTVALALRQEAEIDAGAPRARDGAGAVRLAVVGVGPGRRERRGAAGRAPLGERRAAAGRRRARSRAERHGGLRPRRAARRSARSRRARASARRPSRDLAVARKMLPGVGGAAARARAAAAAAADDVDAVARVAPPPRAAAPVARPDPRARDPVRAWRCSSPAAWDSPERCPRRRRRRCPAAAPLDGGGLGGDRVHARASVVLAWLLVRPLTIGRVAGADPAQAPGGAARAARRPARRRRSSPGSSTRTPRSCS